MLDIFPLRADALFELVDALLLALDPRSPVELSVSPAFRRRFSMAYLLRFGIEHFLRSAKRRLGLLIAQTPGLTASVNWV